jgi:glutamyl-tRNA synthetase
MLKTRFAPSPTGLIHIGNMRTALFNALIAKHGEGIFLLRIEDTDAERSKDEFIEYLEEDLRWLGLDWQEGVEVEGDYGPYRQSQRQEVYNKYYQDLIDNGLAYPCYCTDEQLKLSRKLQRAAGQPPRYDRRCARLSSEEIAKKEAQGLPATLRFKIPDGELVEFEDLVQGKKVFKTDDIGDLIIRRANGMPAFMFCNAVDDALMQVTHALRGEDHITNTPRQILILRALKLTPPKYGHFALINGSDGAPLSKRNGSQSIKEMRDEGYWPEAVVNYLSRLGHYYPNNDYMDVAQLGAEFEMDQLGRSPARYDHTQLNYWQKETFKHKNSEEIWTWMGKEVQALVPQDKKEQFISLITPNVLLPKDALLWAQRAFTEKLELCGEGKSALQGVNPEFFQHAIKAVEQHGLDYKAWVEYLKEHAGVKGKQLFQPLRVALMGTIHGPEMDKWIELIGDEKRIMNRLNNVGVDR